MKVALVYYSFSGNTKRACEYLREEFLLKGAEVEMIEARPRREAHNFFKQCIIALFKKKTALQEDLIYDLQNFDYIIFASAVWALTFTPALRSYLEKAKGLQDKRVGCFVTCGSGTGAQKALNELEGFLKTNGADVACSARLSGLRTGNSTYLDKHLKVFLNQFS